MVALTPILITFLAFLAVAFVVYTVLRPREALARNRLLTYGVQTRGPVTLATPFSGRVLAPLIHWAAGIVRSLSRKQIEDDVRTALAQGGNPGGLDVNRFLALRMVGLLGPPLFLVGPRLLEGTVSLPSLAIGLVGAAVGWNAPWIWLDGRIAARRKMVTQSLPDALDLIIVCVEAGNSLEGALSIVSQRITGPLAEELDRTLREMSLGKGRHDALHDLATRAASPDLQTFIAAVIQADQLGVGIAQVLRVQGDAMRVRRRQRAEEQAAKIPVLMLLPLVLFILPALMIIIIGPIALSIVGFMSGGGAGI